MSVSSHAYKRLCALYRGVLRRMAQPTPGLRSPVVRRRRLEVLESRDLLSAAPVDSGAPLSSAYLAPAVIESLPVHSILPVGTIANAAAASIPAVLGDANGDGFVDGADYVIWANNVHKHDGDATLEQGDFDQDGFVNGTDYVLWANSFQSYNVIPQLSLALANDTAPQGAVNNDHITFDPSITGMLTAGAPVSQIFAQFTVPDGPLVEITDELRADGRFELNAARLSQVLGASLIDGTYELHLTAMNMRGHAIAPASIAFTLDTSPPAIPEFDLSAGSAVVDAQRTTASRVTFVGQTSPHATVLLVETGATTIASNTGTFQFPGVAVNPGQNTFTARAFDLAGNTSPFQLEIERIMHSGLQDPVLRWNQAALEAIRLDATTPPMASRALAMVSAAVYDAVSALEGTPGYAVTMVAPPGASLEAAISGAAHAMLTYLYPGQQAYFDSLLAVALAEVADGPAKSAGLTLGQQVASAFIVLRENDGWDHFVDYLPGMAAGDWQPTAPAYAIAMLPQWATVTPFVMENSSQFRPGGPPALSSQQWADDFNEVKSLGAANSASRTAEQTQIARFWADGPGTYTPPGHWNVIAQQLAEQEGLSPSDTARLFAQLNLVLSDAAILAWDAKYEFNFWRPITAIHQAHLDNNPQTQRDASWQSLLLSPPFPDYISGHSTFSGAAARILASFFGEERSFTTTSLGLPGVARSYSSFDEAAEEAGRSRIYGGIHYQFANQDALNAGRALADYALHQFQLSADVKAPVVIIESPATDAVFATNITLTGRVLDNLSGVASLHYQLGDSPLTSLVFDELGRFGLPLDLALDGSADGVYPISLIAEDFAGNVSSPVTLSFTLDTAAPVIDLASPMLAQSIDISSRITGMADGTGSGIISLAYHFNGHSPVPIAVDPFTGAFDEWLITSHLAVGDHLLTVTAVDAAGNLGITTIDVHLAELAPFTVWGITPSDGSIDVGSTFRPQVFFTRPVDPATLTSDNFFATDTAGGKLPATIVPSTDGTFAWLFFTNALPGASKITIHVLGDTILAQADGAALDADYDGNPGGTLTYRFSTVNLVPLAGTTLSGKVVDPGPDLKPMTFDDMRVGPDGIPFTADDVFLNPIAGVKVFILGLEDQFVLTDADGVFHFDAAPAGTIKLAIDGRTASNAPAGFFFPEMVMDLEIEVGQINTVMSSMGTVAQRVAHRARTEVYLPRLRDDILQTVSDTDVTVVGVIAEAAPNLTPQERQFLKLEVQPGSLIDADGQVMSAAQVGISTVPPELVREMLPPGLLQHTFDITIQAPDAAVFNTPLTITFPNIFNAAPGSKLDFLSFDHTTGRLVIEGTATVSADGLSVTTDPGTGITKPGWHGLTPPGACAGSGGPPLTPQAPKPNDVIVNRDPISVPIAVGDAASMELIIPEIRFTAPAAASSLKVLPPPPGCAVLPRPVDPPYLSVEITVDGPLAEFLREAGDLKLETQSFTLTAGSGIEFVFAAEKRSYSEMFGPTGILNLERPELYVSAVTIKQTSGYSDGSRLVTTQVYYVSRFVDITDNNLNDDVMSFIDTVVNSSNTLTMQVQAPAGFSVGTEGPFTNAGLIDGTSSLQSVSFQPSSVGPREGFLGVRLGNGEIAAVVRLAGFSVPVQRWYLDTTAMLEELRDNFDTVMVDSEKAIFGWLTLSDPDDPQSDLVWQFSDALATVFIESVILATEAKLSAYSSALERAVNPGPNVISIAQFVSPDPSESTALGRASLVDIARSGPFSLWDLLISRSDLNVLQQNYILSRALNEVNHGSIGVFLDKYFDLEDDPYTHAELRNALSKTFAHEIGHELGMVHANNINPADVMAQGIDRAGSRTFTTTDPVMRLALGMIIGRGSAQLAVDYYEKYLSTGLGDSIDPDGDINSFDPIVIGGGIARISSLVTGEYTPAVEFAPARLEQTSSSTALLLSNIGDQPLTLGNVAILGGNGQFSVSGLTPGNTVAPGASIPFEVAFTPHDLGPSSATLQIANSGLGSSLSIGLKGLGLQPLAHGLVTSWSNNLGGAEPGATKLGSEVATITNFGATPLRITGVELVTGAPAFALVGIPTDLATSPVVLGPGESFSFGATFAPDRLGLLRGSVRVTTDSTTTPTLDVSLVGTGVETLPIASWGHDYVSVTTTSATGATNTIRVRSDAAGNFNMFLPSSTGYEISIYDPQTGLIARGVGRTSPSGRGTDLTASLVFLPSTAPDRDGDGLPDDIEFAVGTSPQAPDTDGDGLDDFAELQLGLDPFGGRTFATGVVANVALQGNAREVVVEGSTLDPSRQFAYVATGSYGLAIVDATNFQQPLVLSQITLPGEAADVAVDSGLQLAAVANTAGGLHVVDVSDPSSPFLARTIVDTFTPVPIEQVEVVDGVAYAGLGGQLVAYDLLTGERLDTLNLGLSPIRGLAREGSLLFIMDASRVLRAIELSGSTMVLRGSLTLPVGSGRIFVGDGVAYVAAGAGFATVDVSNPNNLTLISGVDAANIEGRAVVANGSGLAVGIGSVIGPVGPIHALDLVDVSDPANTAGFLTRFMLPSAPQSVAIGAGVAYVAGGTSGLVVVNYLPFDNQAQPPTVSIVTAAEDEDPDSPGIQVLEGATLPVRVIVSDDVQVRSVELLVNGQVVRNDVAFPFDLAAIGLGPEGVTRVQVRATDTGGNTALSNELVFLLLPDETPPEIVSITPDDGSTLAAGLRRVTVEFSESMALTTIVPAHFSLESAGPDGVFDTSDDVVIPLTLQTRHDARTVPITFPALEAGSYRLTIVSAAVTDRAGNSLSDEDFVTAFTLTSSDRYFEIEGFTPHYGVGDNPQDIAAGDLDGDGIEDLVVVNQSSNTVSVLLSDGRGGIKSRTDFQVGVSPRRVVLGDIDGDGDLDLVTSNYTDGTVSILTNDGVGGFGSRVDISIGTGALSLALADVDGDGDLDLIASHVTGNTKISIFRNDGSGTFGSRQDVATGFNTRFNLAVGDVDGDGDIDIVTSVGHLLRNNGTGAFSGISTAFTSLGFERIALGDLDGDGDLDLVSSTNGVATLLNNGSGLFGSRVNLPVSSTSSVVLRDIDGDGDLDVIASTSLGPVQVFFNNGAGAFGSGHGYRVGNTLRAATVADLNGDGHLDIAVVTAANNVAVLLNDGATHFATPVTTLPAQPFAMAAGDLNGDGQLDVVTANINGNNVSVIFYDAEGGVTRVDILVGNSPRSVALGDIDGDGDLDIVVANANSNSVTVLFNNGTGSFASRVDYAVGTSPRFVLLGDVDGDGTLDIITANFSSNNLTILRNDGAGVFGNRTDFSGVTQNSVLALGDVDGDGDLDLIVSNDTGSNATRLFLNDGAGAFTLAGTIFTGTGARSIVLGDIDADGDLDLIATSTYSVDSLVVIRNDGTGNFPQLSSGSARTIIPLASRPQMLALGDLDGDGFLDLVTANFSDNNASVMLNDGAGNFSGALDYVTGRGPRAVVLGDIDGDGDLDLLTADYTDATASFLHNDGAGRFGMPIYPVGRGLRSIATGDFNGDGILDVVTVNENAGPAGRITLLLGQAGGGFATAVQLIDLALAPFKSVVAGDIDGDGDLDLLVASYVGGTTSRIYLLRNNGLGVFTGESIIQTAMQPRALALADLNGDGHLDLVATGNAIENTPQGVTVFMNNGMGHFEPPTSYALSTIAQSLALLDLNGDGFLDIVSVNPTSNSASVLINDGAGGFGYPTIPVGNQPRSIAIGDIDGDGDLDVVVANYFSNNIVILRNSPTGFVTETPDLLSFFSEAVSLGDLDGDGDLDLIALDTALGVVTRFLNAGNGTFEQRTDYLVGTEPRHLALGDIDGDGDLDIVVANYLSATVSVLVNIGDGAFNVANAYEVAPGPRFVALADVNSDGFLDFATANWVSSSVSLLLNNGSGGFGSRTDIPVGTHPHALAFGDLDGDGHLDLVTANLTSASVTRLLNDGTGVFASRIDTPVGLNPTSIAIGDIDGDGDLDVMTGHSHVNLMGLTLLRNDGTGLLGSRLDVAVGVHPPYLQLADIDGDGDLDVVTANITSVSIIRNDGLGNFELLPHYSVGMNPQSVAVADVNGDGYPDIITANTNSGTISVLLNDGFGVFDSRIDFVATSGPRSIIAADIDGDGHIDLITANRGVDNMGSISVFLNDGSGGFLKRLDYLVNSRSLDVIRLGDVDGDGDLDIIAGSYDDGGVIVLKVKLSSL